LSETSNQNPAHTPVLLREVLEQAKATAVDLGRPLRFGFDGTFGRGGHTGALLKDHAELVMIAFDQDAQAIEFGSQVFATAIASHRLHLVRANFENLPNEVTCFDFMLLDLGVSSPQLDVAERGFSFYHDGPLDMRMDDRIELTAAKIVNEWPEQDLARIFIGHGEVERPFKVIRAILQDRVAKPFTSTKQLAQLIERVDGWAKKGFHPATQYFMALRLEINRELDVVTKVMPDAVKRLSPGGRLAVITFHSLEDRIVKNFIRAVEDEGAMGPDFGESVKRKPIVPSDIEIKQNPRSRSAKLRMFRRYKTGEQKGSKNKYAHLAAIRHGEPPEESEGEG
jgi:16S rRNA (cytosine1402-N4)-methyltransferase